MKGWRWVLAGVVLLMTAACSPEPLMSMGAVEELAQDAAALVLPEDAGEEAGAVNLTEENDGETVRLTTGQELHVRLGGNPTTGYSWETEGLDESVLRLAGEPEYQPASDALGSGGEFDFTFLAENAGETALRLIYHRTFEKDVPPQRSFSVTVVVEE